MEERKLTKADIDKVRHIEGFPIGKDEDIIALSRPPYYTACPNPFIEDFIRENGTPYDEATDDYHREPFAADVSEGKNDPIYMAHGYHTKVPFKAIMRYILHYTKPGDIVLDGFCGSGMTGVAAQMCGSQDAAAKCQIEQEMFSSNIVWGERKAILNDLAPAATFIAQNYNASYSCDKYDSDAASLLLRVKKKYDWMYKTRHSSLDSSKGFFDELNCPTVYGDIVYTVWSDVFVCPSCSKEVTFYDAALDKNSGMVLDRMVCEHCGATFAKRDCSHVFESFIDPDTGEAINIIKQIPVRIVYSVGNKRYEKKPDEYDMDVLERIEREPVPKNAPWITIPDGIKTHDPIRLGITKVALLFTKRNLLALCALIQENESDALRFAINATMQNASKMYRYRSNGKGGCMSGVIYIPSTPQENNVFTIFERKTNDIRTTLRIRNKDNIRVSCGSTTNLSTISTNAIDYIFTDPPFGDNLMYSDLNFMWESWFKVTTNTTSEAIMNRAQRKGLVEYQELMGQCFSEYYRVLKPNRWITIEFHNSKNSVWNSIQEALLRAGFVVADVRVINKKQGSYNQVTAAGAVQQDLVISAYKPKESFVREFQSRAGDPEMAWEFVREHLRNVPVFADGNHDGKLDVIAERQDYLLFDRMVAWHIMNGIPVPMDAHTFYDGLRQRFLQRDGMFFLPDQVNEYDDKRAHMELDAQQLSFIVSDEKNAIAWLNYILRDGPKTYQEIQPAYLQELHQSKQEKMPELLDMLKENFIQDDKGAWYVPDLSNAADLAKVRRKALLKEFYDSCVPGKGKLKVFRMEAIRAGFDECWKTRDFKTIVSVGERLPESVLQEDPALLMYYDNACARV